MKKLLLSIFLIISLPAVISLALLWPLACPDFPFCSYQEDETKTLPRKALPAILPEKKNQEQSYRAAIMKKAIAPAPDEEKEHNPGFLFRGVNIVEVPQELLPYAFHPGPRRDEVVRLVKIAVAQDDKIKKLIAAELAPEIDEHLPDNLDKMIRNRIGIAKAIYAAHLQEKLESLQFIKQLLENDYSSETRLGKAIRRVAARMALEKGCDRSSPEIHPILSYEYALSKIRIEDNACDQLLPYDWILSEAVKGQPSMLEEIMQFVGNPKYSHTHHEILNRYVSLCPDVMSEMRKICDWSKYGIARTTQDFEASVGHFFEQAHVTKERYADNEDISKKIREAMLDWGTPATSPAPETYIGDGSSYESLHSFSSVYWRSHDGRTLVFYGNRSDDMVLLIVTQEGFKEAEVGGYGQVVQITDVDDDGNIEAWIEEILEGDQSEFYYVEQFGNKFSYFVDGSKPHSSLEREPY